MIASDGCEICKCDTVETCPDGQVKVKNYVDGIGACGEVCCEWKEDKSSVYHHEYEGKIMQSDYSWSKNYAVVATNNVCEGRYQIVGAKRVNFDGSVDGPGEGSGSISVKENGGKYYPADEFESAFLPRIGSVERWYYPSNNTYCSQRWDSINGWNNPYCLCSDSGNPLYGSSCE